jgi:hypothetical protein
MLEMGGGTMTYDVKMRMRGGMGPPGASCEKRSWICIRFVVIHLEPISVREDGRYWQQMWTTSFAEVMADQTSGRTFSRYVTHAIQ